MAIRPFLTEPKVVVSAFNWNPRSFIGLIRIVFFVMLLFLKFLLLKWWSWISIHAFYLINIKNLRWYWNHVLVPRQKVGALALNRLGQIYGVLIRLRPSLPRESHLCVSLLLRLLNGLLVHHLILKLVHQPEVLLLHNLKLLLYYLLLSWHSSPKSTSPLETKVCHAANELCL